MVHVFGTQKVQIKLIQYFRHVDKAAIWQVGLPAKKLMHQSQVQFSAKTFPASFGFLEINKIEMAAGSQGIYPVW